MNVRALETGDDIEDLIRRSVSDVKPSSYTEEQQRHLEAVIPEMNLDFAGKERYRYFVAEGKNGIDGVAGYQKQSGSLAGIFVDPELKESGIGSRLMKKLENDARSLGLEQMETLASLEAVEFYRKNGYTVEESKKQDIEGKEIGVKVMTKDL